MNANIAEFRRVLHQHPELSGEEFETSTRIKNYLSQFKNAELITEIGGQGLAAIFTYGQKGPVLLFRTELDALPIEEENILPYKSVNKGRSHKCGHDGHMAILCGLAEWLNTVHFEKGKVILLFQPAEETGEGAYRVIHDEKFLKQIKPDYAFALHNLPGYDMHEVVVIDEVFTPDVRSLGIYFKGLQSHASEPEKGINPAVCMAELTLELDKLNVQDIRSKNFALLTPVYSKLGARAYGISAGEGELHYTIRTASNSTMEVLINKIKVLTKQLTGKHNLKYEIEWFDHFPLTINDPHCNELIRKSAKKNNLKLTGQEDFIRFGEDFGWFSQKFPSSMFGLGSGKKTPPLHNPLYDFPDELLPTGMNMFKGIVEEILG